ncbi:MAG: hypothetical protein Q8L00_01480, partial [Deltaproteobacteria bacterium]|nr:hypothetical protein [Deltaproteobacteria bacterium]
MIRTITDFRRHYRQLGSGDVIIGVLSLRPGEEIKVLDLAGILPEFQAREAVVAKRDRAHLGLAVSLWPSLVPLYSVAGLQGLTYP